MGLGSLGQIYTYGGKYRRERELTPTKVALQLIRAKLDYSLYDRMTTTLVQYNLRKLPTVDRENHEVFGSFQWPRAITEFGYPRVMVLGIKTAMSSLTQECQED